MIHVVPYAGLANRMRVIASAVELAEATTTDVRVLWEVDCEMCCSFEDLFEPISNVPFTSLKSREDLEKKVTSSVNVNWANELRVKKTNQKQGYDYVILNEDIPHIKQTQPGLFKNIVSNNNNVLISSVRALSISANYYQKLFIPVSDIKAKIESIKKKITEKTIGLHIRRTDSEKSIEFSPIKLFEEVVDKEIKAGKNIFLATDDAEVEQFFLDKYPQQILVNPNKEFNRNSKEGVQDAVVDLFCLSNTTHIYGSFWSSYSKAAARFHNADLTILKTAK